MPLISIIIPLFNRENLISETIESVLAQTYSYWELIIIDDGSTDNSVEIAKTFAAKSNRIQLFQRDRLPKGASACRNIGAEKANGDYLIFLDSDDLLAPFCLDQRIKIMQENSDLDFAVFNLELFQFKVHDLNQKFNIYFENNIDYLKSFIIDSPPWAINCPIWKKNFFLNIGGFDEDFWVMDDPELHVRALLVNNVCFKVIIDSQTDCFYRINYTNNAKFYKDSIEGRIKFIKKVNSLIQESGNNVLLITLKKGIKTMSKSWFFAHIKEYKFGVFDFLNWAKTVKLLSTKDYYLAKIVCFLWFKNYYIVNKLRLKGLLTWMFKVILITNITI